MFKSYTKAQALETLDACHELLVKVLEKGNQSFDETDNNVLNNCISTLFILMTDTEEVLQTTPFYCALGKAKTKLHSQKIKNQTDFFNYRDIKTDMKEAIQYVTEAIGILKTENTGN